MKTTWTADQIRKVIAARFPWPEFATFFQVANTTGFEKKRFADAISVSMWESRGLAISGFEIKVSRADFLKELRSPEKMDPFFEHIHQWFLVAPAGLVEDKDQLPPTWGLLEINGSPDKPIMKLVKAAPHKDVSDQMCRKFFTVLLRHAFDKRPESRQLREAFEEGYSQASEYRKQQKEREKSNELTSLENLEKTVAEFQQATGLNVTDRWRWPSKEQVQAWNKFEGAMQAVKEINRQVDLLEEASEKALELFTKAKQSAGIEVNNLKVG